MSSTTWMTGSTRRPGRSLADHAGATTLWENLRNETMRLDRPRSAIPGPPAAGGVSTASAGQTVASSRRECHIEWHPRHLSCRTRHVGGALRKRLGPGARSDRLVAWLAWLV